MPVEGPSERARRLRSPDPQGTKSKLVIVADIDDRQLRQRIHRLLCDHDVRFIEVDELPGFAEEVERVAH